MKNIIKYIIAVILVNPSFLLLAQTNQETPIKDPSMILEQVSAFSQKTHTITADFTQVKDMSFLEEKATSSGKFYFQKEKQLRWEYTGPFSYAIILNGDRIRIIDEGRVKDFDAGSNRMFLEISNVMTGMVNGTLLTGKQFSTTWSEAPGHYKALLVPTSQALKDYLDHIELKLDKNDFSVDELKMFEKTGDHTLITFKNKKLNEEMPADIFRLD